MFQLPTSKINVIVSNAAVLMSILRVPENMRASAGVWQGDEFMLPGVYSQTRPENIGGVRFKSAAVGVPAQVTVRAS